jgi:hypothetical protein
MAMVVVVLFLIDFLSLSLFPWRNLEYRRNGFFRELDKRPNFSVGEENNT